MMNFTFPMAASPDGDKHSPAGPTGLEVIYIVGDCPFELRCRDVKPLRSDARAVLVVLNLEEACWASRIADAIDAWETARQSDDPFWIAAVFRQIERLARTSDGLMIFMPAVADGERLAGIA
jgi:hypothetical protein